MPYAAEVYNRGMRLSAGSFEAWSQHLQDPSAYEAPEKDLLICSLDLLASLAQGLQHDFARIHATCQTSVLTVMTLSMKVKVCCQGYATTNAAYYSTPRRISGSQRLHCWAT